MYSNKLRRQYKREVYKLVTEMRQDQKKKPTKVRATLIRVTLRQRSGHYQNKGLRRLVTNDVGRIDAGDQAAILTQSVASVLDEEPKDFTFDNCSHCGDANKNCVCDGGTGRDFYV